MPQDQISNPSEVLNIALADLYIPDWNPRQHIDQAEMDDLVAHLENGGFVPRILLWKGPTSKAPFAVISGQRRMLAFERLERTHIPAEILDVSLAEARRMARDTNIDAKPHWLDDGINLESLLADNLISQRELAKNEKNNKSTLNRTVLLMKILNPEARALIRQSLTAPKPVTGTLDPESVPPRDTDSENKGNSWVLLRKVAFQVTGFVPNRRLEEAQAMALEALKVIIDRQLSSPQATALVQWSLAGKPISEFDPALRPAKSTSSKVATSAHEAEAHVSEPKTPQAAKTDSHPSKPSISTPTASTQMQASPVGDQPSKGLTSGEALIWEGLAGMSLVARIKTKIKKGERPSLFEGLVLVADLLWRGLAWVAKHSWKVAKWLLKETWKSSKATLRMLGAKVLRIVGGVLGFLFLCFVLWFGWDAYERGILHPFQELENLWAITHVTQQAPKPVVHVPIVKPVSSAPVSTQAGTQQPNSVVQPVVSSEVPKAVVKEKASTTVPEKVANVSVSPTVSVKKADAIDDLASTVAKQAGPGAAADAAKKIFGL